MFCFSITSRMINLIPKQVQEGVLKILKDPFSENVVLRHFSFAGGGCINSGGKLVTSFANYFLKWNSAAQFPGMFESEAKGLRLLQATKTIDTPSVVGHGIEGAYQFLLLEFIESNNRSKNFWIQLGHQLANLHKINSNLAGLDHNNYIGSLPQINDQKKSWIEFFIERLEFQIKMLPQSDHQLNAMFESLYTHLPSLLVEEPHSLLHGDLWGGNVVVTSKGEPCLIDPAVYFGNREIEIAFTLLFGGFDDAFHSGYREIFPLQTGFRERIPVHNLYPLLVHANLFGGGYLSQVKSILKRYV